MSSELPYPTAQRLRAAGQSDDAILAALTADGVSPEDAAVTVQSLPGNQLAAEQTVNARSSNVYIPIAGAFLFAGGVGALLISYFSASPGESEIAWWGFMLATFLHVARE